MVKKVFSGMNYKKITVIVLIIGILLRFLLTSMSHVSGDACWHLSIARFVGENYQIPLFEDLGRDSVFSRPPLFHIMAAVLYNIFGIFGIAAAGFGLKMLSPLSGSLTLIIFYLLTKKFFNEKLVFIAVSVLAFLPLHIYYSTISYVESAVGLFALISVFFMVEKRLFLSAVFAGLTALLKFEGIFIFPTVLSILFYNNRKNLKGFIKKGILFGIIAMLIFVPYLARNFVYLGNPFWPHLSKFIPGYPVVDKAYLDSDISNLFDVDNLAIPYFELFGIPNGNYRLFSFFNAPFMPIFISIWLIATLAYFSFFVYGIIKSNKKSAPVALALIWIITYAVLVLLTTIFQDLPQARFLVPAMPAFALIWAIGINESFRIKKLKKIIIPAIILIIVGFVFVEFAKTAYAASEWDKYKDDFEWIKVNTGKDSTIFYTGQCLTYNTGRFTINAYIPITKEFNAPKELSEIKEAYIWVNQDFRLEGQSILPKDIEKFVENNYRLVYENRKTGTRLYKIKD